MSSHVMLIFVEPLVRPSLMHAPNQREREVFLKVNDSLCGSTFIFCDLYFCLGFIHNFLDV